MLLTPGPVPVPDFVWEAMRQPVIHHRSEAFGQFYASLREKLAYLFQTQQTVGTLIGSGTQGMEAMLYSLFAPGTTILVLEHGKFSRRWVDYGAVMGLEVHTAQVAWGQAFSPPAVLSAYEAVPACKGLVITHCETSTGTLNDLEEIVFALKQAKPDALIVVDAITSVGALPFYFDAWQIDAAVVASQKALMNPVGTVAFALSEAACTQLRQTHPADAANLYNYVQALSQNAYPYSAPVPALYGLKAALDHLAHKGLPQVWQEVHAAAQTFRRSLAEINGTLLSQSPSDSLTAFQVPDTESESLRQQLKASAGYILAGGQGPWKGKALRIAHFGLAAHTELMRKVSQQLGQLLRT